MKKLIVIILSIFIFSNCSEEDNFQSVNIRLSNKSDFDFKNIIVNTSTGNVAYDNLKSGKISEYKTFDMAYSYAFIELTINDEIYTLQPVDFVGEIPLKNGKYTYVLDAIIQGQSKNLTLRFIKE